MVAFDANPAQCVPISLPVMCHAGGARRTDPCKICPQGTFSPGGSTDSCTPCGFGFTSPEGSTDVKNCIEVNACPAGTEYRDGPNKAFALSDCVCKPGYGSSTGMAPCHLCPPGMFSDGGSLEGCKPCPFGFTSRDGARSMDDCQPMAQACPIGQYAPEGAISKAQCRCYNGFGGRFNLISLWQARP